MGSRNAQRTCIALITLVLCGLAATAKPQPALASRGLLVGIADSVQPFVAPDKTFPLLEKLRAQVIRVDLNWGSVVAKTKPDHPTDPADPAYDWESYDTLVRNAAKSKIQVLFTIYGTPRWANGSAKGLNRAPRRMVFLQQFATAAAKRYSGTFKPENADTALPAVRKWLAWNEPNNPVFLTPQWAKINSRRYIPVAARTYARMCEAVWSGVHSTGLKKEVVACGATDPRGNNRARGARPSISPLVFLASLKKYGLRHFDVYAHHPYYSRPTESPTTKPRAKTVITLANLSELTSLLTKLYGNKKLWITEYGYQTRPPDPVFGVSWAKQARYLTEAYAIARKNPRITMMLWFLLRDETRLAGWQSGFFTASGTKKPAYDAFRRLPH